MLILCTLGCTTEKTTRPISIYAQETNGVQNLQLIEIARDFVKTNPTEIYNDDRKFPEERAIDILDDMLELVLDTAPSTVVFLKEDQKFNSELKTFVSYPYNKYKIIWGTCWSKRNELGECDAPRTTFLVVINQDLEAEKIEFYSFL